MSGKVQVRRKALSDLQLVKLLSHPAPPPLPDFMRIALLTGARIGELCGMTAVHRADGWWFVIEEGKTEAAARGVPVHEAIAPIAARWGSLKANKATASKAFGRFRKRAGVAEARADFHALRNTFISMMEGEGAPESTVKLLVGHKRESMTYRRYSHGERVNLRKAIERARYSQEVMTLLQAG